MAGLRDCRHLRVQDRERRLAIERVGEEPGDRLLEREVGRLLGERARHRREEAADQLGDQPAEEREQEPRPEGDQRRRRRSPDENRQEQPERKPERDVQERHDHPERDPEQLLGARHDAEPDDPERGDHAHDERQDQPDDGQAGRELAVDHVVAVDRLGKEGAADVPLARSPFTASNANGDPEQRSDDRDELPGPRAVGRRYRRRSARA